MKEFDALLIHGQGYTNPPGEFPRPSNRGRMDIAAARYLNTKGIRVKNYFFSGFAFPGQEIPLAQVDAQELINKNGVDPSSVHVDTTARTTSMEIAAFKQKSDEMGWTSLLDLTVGSHKKEVELITERTVRVAVLSAEEILLSLPQEEERIVYERQIRRFHRSKNELRVRVYERIKHAIISVPFGVTLLEKISHIYRPDPS